MCMARSDFQRHAHINRNIHKKGVKKVGRYVLKRIASLIPILLAVSFIVFFLMSLTGDPIATITGGEVSDEIMEEMREAYGLNDPFIVRYGRYLWGVLHGDFGKDLSGRDVLKLYMSRLPYTVLLAFSGLLLATIIAIPFGIIAAIKQNTWIDTMVSTLSVAGMSIPNYWLALLLIVYFAVMKGLLPTSGAEKPVSLIMPAICAGIKWSALIARTTRSAMLDCLREDYLRTARIKGVKERLVVLKHAYGNAQIPVITTIGNALSSLIGGTVVVEQVFAWPGIGNLTISAVRGNEYTLVTGSVIITTILVAVVLLAIDLLYAYIDPRIKAKYTRK